MGNAQPFPQSTIQFCQGTIVPFILCLCLQAVVPKACPEMYRFSDISIQQPPGVDRRWGHLPIKLAILAKQHGLGNQYIILECHPKSRLVQFFEKLSCFNPYLGVRLGEAKNPGPKHIEQDHDVAVLAIVNPTAIRNKEGEFQTLMNTHGVDTICCSETTATIEVQNDMTKKIRKLQMRTVWSDPVPQQRQRVDAQPCMRGRVGGTSIHSKWPVREALSQKLKPLHAADRLTHVVIQWGSLYLQIIAVYGFAGGNAGHKQATNELFTHAIQMSEMINLPALFVGDFNMDVHQLEQFDRLRSQGYMSLQMIHELYWGSPMPPTCKGATTPDTALIPPVLLQRIQTFAIDDQALFDAHSPVIIAFQVPKQTIFNVRMKMPKSWADLPLTQEDIQQACVTTCLDPQPTNLAEWAELVEKTVDVAIQNDHSNNPQLQPLKALPKRYKGRCLPAKFVKLPHVTPCKKARDGDFNPQIETASYKSKLLVKQIRRINSLQKRLQSLAGLEQIWKRTTISLWQEWNAINRWRFDHRSFCHWADDIPELFPCPKHLPSIDWLCMCSQFLKQALDQSLHVEQKMRMAKAKMKLLTEYESNHMKGMFQAVRRHEYKPFHHVFSELDEQGILIPADDGTFECYVDRPQRFSALLPIAIDGTEAKILQIQADRLQLEMSSDDVAGPEVTVTQKGPTFHQQEVFDALNDYWMPFWNNQVPEDPATFQEAFNMPMPTFPAMPDDFENDVQAWMHAIRTSKASSAPGADGFTFRELKLLPEALIKSLVSIICQLDQFPQETMLARTVPIPKKNQLTASNSRPITVLATLYRLWGKVCARRCLKHFAQHMSSAVTGMLPKRGAHTASYKMQAYLEKQRYLCQPTTGITLDLLKCFNLLCRRKVQFLVENLGVPPRLASKWMQSLGNMQRYWDIASCTSERVTTNTGCPEGDSWSVVAILAVTETWCQVIQKHMPDVGISAYADNWTVWMPENQANPFPLQRTSRYISWLGLRISWDKTWIWGTTDDCAKAFQLLLSPHFPVEEIQIKATTTDLGCQMTYHGNAKLGILVDRFAQAKLRLDVVKQSTWPLPVKAHVIQAAILPLALYGAELVTVGQKNLVNLRSMIADALVGETIQTLNSAIFTQCVDARDMDPCIKVIISAVKQARRYLRSANEEDKQAFLAILSQPSKRSGLSQGPASALREYLGRIGLSCSKSGNIQMTALVTCNLLDDSFCDLRKFVRQAWQSQLLMMETQRPKLYNLPPINSEETLRLLRQFQPKQQLLLLREISGGYQTQKQKSHWTETSELCTFCEAEPDTKQHRAFFCLSFHDVRDEFREVVNQFLEINPDIVELPVLHMHPHYEFHDALLRAMPEPSLEASVFQTIQDADLTLPVFYTDGSCKFPNSPSTRFSAFAIVVDLCQTDPQRNQQAQMYRYTGQFPDTLQKLVVARTVGRQCIHRAELQALLFLFENFSRFQVHTDSATAILQIQLCRNAVDLEELAEHDDFDILRRIFRCITPEKQVLKVKAHQNLAEIPDHLSLYHALGNHLVDKTANHACMHLFPEIVQQLQEFHDDLNNQRVLLQPYFNLNLALQQARARSTATPVESETCNEPRDIQQKFCNWTVLDPWKPPVDIGDDEVYHAAWGLQWSVAILEWFAHCKWPSEKLEGDPGISWAEIALSLVLQQNMWLPVKRKRHGADLILQAHTQAEAIGLQLTLAEQATSAYSMITQLFGLVEQRIVPPDTGMGKVRSLYWQGFPAWTTGLTTRPQYANQAQVFALLQIQLTSGKGLHTLPDLVFSDDTSPWTEDLDRALITFDEKTRIVKLAMKRVRNRRKEFH